MAMPPRRMSHEEAFPELGAAALEALGADEQAAVLAHASGCGICKAELTRMYDAAASITDVNGTAAPAEHRSAEIRSALLQRAKAQPPARGSDPLAREYQARKEILAQHTRATAGRTARVASFAVAASLLLAVVAGWQWWRGSVLRGNAAAMQARIDSLQSELDSQGRMVASIAGPEVVVVELTASGAARPPRARMFWDRATDRWTFFAHDMAPPQQGKTYQLWLVTRDAKVSAGTFTPGATGTALVQATYDLGTQALQAIAVTEEPAGGVQQPTGPVIIAGASSR